MSAPTGAGDLEASAFAAKLQNAIAVARLHQFENAAVEAAVADLETTLKDLVTRHGRISIKVDAANDTIFLNDRAVRAAGAASAAAGSRSITKKMSLQALDALSRLLAQLGVGELRFTRALDRATTRALLGEIKKASTGPNPAKNVAALVAGIREKGVERAGVTVLSVEQAAVKAVDRRTIKVDEESAVRLAYGRTLALVRQYLKYLRDEELHAYFARKLVRAVQGLQAHVVSKRHELLALALVKDADEPPFQHAVNTCLLVLLLGTRLGLPKALLTKAGVAALLHGVGKFRTREAVIERPESERTRGESEEYRRHPYRAVDAFLDSRKLDDLLLTCALVAFDQEGKIAPVRGKPREPHPLSRIVAVAAAFDDATSDRPGVPAVSPAEALARMRKSEHSQALVDLLVNTVGLYPPGTAVRLSSGEVAIVVHPNEEDAKRPVVEVVRDTFGEDVKDGALLDLASKNKSGNFERSVSGTVDAAALRLRIPEYLALS